MSVTVADLLILPSLREAKVLGGEKGLSKIVSSISVLESTDPKLLVDGLFPQKDFFGSEIVITGFLNMVNDVDCQCANMIRLAEGGEVGLIVYYVGVYLPKIDQRLIDVANEKDFVLICMPEGQRLLRYSEVLTDVMECIYRDRMRNESIVSEILGRVARLPSHQKSVNTVLKMLSDRLSASVILTDASYHVINLIAWPRSNEESVKKLVLKLKKTLTHGVKIISSETADYQVYYQKLESDANQQMELIVMKEGIPLEMELLKQAVDVVRLSVNIWGRKHGEVALHELARAILQDDPIKMRRLAEIFRVDVKRIHEMWIVHSDRKKFKELLPELLKETRKITSDFQEMEFMDTYEDTILMFLDTPESPTIADQYLEEIMNAISKEVEGVSITRCGSLDKTADVRRAYLCHREYLNDVKKIFPRKSSFFLGEVLFAQECRELVNQGEDILEKTVGLITTLTTEKDELDLKETLTIYLLDGESSVTKTAELLYLHKNTIKYRLQKMAQLLGFRPDKMPEAMKLYRAVAVERLIS